MHLCYRSRSTQGAVSHNLGKFRYTFGEDSSPHPPLLLGARGQAGEGGGDGLARGQAVSTGGLWGLRGTIWKEQKGPEKGREKTLGRSCGGMLTDAFRNVPVLCPEGLHLSPVPSVRDVLTPQRAVTQLR